MDPDSQENGIHDLPQQVLQNLVLEAFLVDDGNDRDLNYKVNHVCENKVSQHYISHEEDQ